MLDPTPSFFVRIRFRDGGARSEYGLDRTVQFGTDRSLQ
ncbi:hypothetical protein HALLA_17855 [Halostagnicola larsenii XH-48]|uniref:Uncharacterized protein n=1 Tax=Halostagnicola larsenii XH-48 TaxID=797299 RepID=W0JQY0_9EURY|nr:hypothetical protein HALLA_17855 [Halostagnicola larsenii XH-48]